MRSYSRRLPLVTLLCFATLFGPTRMDYDHAFPAVGFFAHTLSQTLTRLSRL